MERWERSSFELLYRWSSLLDLRGVAPLDDVGRRRARRSSDFLRLDLADFRSHDKTHFSGNKRGSSSTKKHESFCRSRFSFSAAFSIMAFRSFSAIIFATRSFSAISFFRFSISSCSLKICSSFARSFASLCFSKALLAIRLSLSSFSYERPSISFCSLASSEACWTFSFGFRFSSLLRCCRLRSTSSTCFSLLVSGGLATTTPTTSSFLTLSSSL